MKSSSLKTTSPAQHQKSASCLTTLILKKNETVMMEDDFAINVVLHPSDLTQFRKKKK